MEKKLKSKKYRNSGGAALIIALMVVAAISGITFFSSRLMIKELIIESRFEDSMRAYYVAEAGIEQGLLMVRNNKNTETSLDATDTTGDPIKVVMDDSSSYNLKIWYKKSGNETGQLKKDEIVEYDITGASINLDWSSLSDKEFLEYYIINSQDIVDYNRKDLLNMLSTEKPLRNLSGKMLRLHYYNNTGDPEKILNYTISENTGKPVNSRMHIIESTGTYGSNKRKIRVELDRMSGKIFGIFDYVLFGNTEISN